MPVIVDEATWVSAQRTNVQTHARRDASRYPLKGHFLCACGAPMNGYQKPKPGRNFLYYRCTFGLHLRLPCPAFGRRAPAVRADLMEQRAREALSSWFDAPNLAQLLNAHSSAQPDPYAEQREDLDAKMAKLVDLHLDSLIDRPTFERRRNALLIERANLEPAPLPAPVLPPDLSGLQAQLAGASAAELTELLELLQVRFQLNEDLSVNLVSLAIPLS